MTNPKHTLTVTNVKEVLIFLWIFFSAPYILLYDILSGKRDGFEASDIGGALGEFYLVLAAVISGGIQFVLFVVALIVLAIWWFVQ